MDLGFFFPLIKKKNRNNVLGGWEEKEASLMSYKLGGCEQHMVMGAQLALWKM